MIFEVLTSEQTTNFLLIPEVWERAADDNSRREFDIPSSTMKLGAFVDGTLASVALFSPFRDGWKLHFYVLRRFRLKHAREAIKSIMSAMHAEFIVYVAIPTLYREVINFAKRSGFRELEIEPATATIGGKTYDRVILWDS